MRTLIMLLVLFLSLNFVTTSCSKSQEEPRNDCGWQVELVIDAFKRCNSPRENVESFLKEESECYIYSTQASNNRETCRDNLENLSCDEVNKIKKINDITPNLSCFDFPKKTKKDACIQNYDSYCRDIFYECGKTALKGICNEAKHIYGSSESKEISFDKTKLNNLCKSTVNADEELKNKYDFFSYTCSKYRDNLDCNNIQEIDFRNDDWKTQCSQN